MEHEEMGLPICKADIERALIELYPDKEIPAASRVLLERVEIDRGNEQLVELYKKVRNEEIRARKLLLAFDEDYPEALKEGSVSEIVAQLVIKDAST